MLLNLKSLVLSQKSFFIIVKHQPLQVRSVYLIFNQKKTVLTKKLDYSHETIKHQPLQAAEHVDPVLVSPVEIDGEESRKRDEDRNEVEHRHYCRL